MKINEILLADKNSPVSRLDPPQDEESMIMRLIRQKLKSGDKIQRRLRKGAESTEPAYLTHVIVNDAGDETKLIFTTSKGKQNFVRLGKFDPEKEIWELVKAPVGKNMWILTRTVNEVLDTSIPMLAQLMKRALERGEKIELWLDSHKRNSPTVGGQDWVQERGTMLYPWQVEHRGKALNNRQTVAISFFTGEGDDFDTTYFFADVFDTEFDLEKVNKPDEDTGKDFYWRLVNAPGHERPQLKATSRPMRKA